MKRYTLTSLFFIMPIMLTLLLSGCWLGAPHQLSIALEPIVLPDQLLASCPVSNGFDYPVGRPDAEGYYNAQKFGENSHLGEDWNAVTGGDTDLGDPVYAISDGVVLMAKDVKNGWGNVVRIIHNYGTASKPRYVESLYAHLDEIMVGKKGVIVKKGEKIGTIGNANGRYLAHLHFEMRDDINMPIGKGYSTNKGGYIEPSLFIQSHRILF